jgi:hypothetical protein
MLYSYIVSSEKKKISAISDRQVIVQPKNITDEKTI